MESQSNSLDGHLGSYELVHALVAMPIKSHDVSLEIFSSTIWVAITVVQPISNVRIYDCNGSGHWL
jgi:hypothetical protein